MMLIEDGNEPVIAQLIYPVLTVLNNFSIGNSHFLQNATVILHNELKNPKQ